ncbi:RHS repeat-associated core domain-containing protein, partial [Pseudomonas syringae group genomosp. 7]|uniref:RHS repeat-associated core domain-containing protein n=1 Tax=Pseudomonas syringae group genomosp. 7 TaxID=251699 RepID=UPI0037701720
LISQESYYPFGGTSWSTGRNIIEASYKTVRYSAKERDATWLYYYGLRYYATWLQRWINPDPAGIEDGLNLNGKLSNNPLTNI